MDFEEVMKQAMTEVKDLIASQRDTVGSDVTRLTAAIEEVKAIADTTGQRSDSLDAELAKLAGQVSELAQKIQTPADPDGSNRGIDWSGYEIRSLQDAERKPLDFIREIRGVVTTGDFPKTPQAGVPQARLQWPTGVIDMIPAVATKANTVDQIRETTNSALGYAHYLAAANYLTTDTTITLDGVDGLLAGTDLRINNGTATVVKSISSINTSTNVVTLGAAIGIAGSTGDDIYSTVFGVVGEAGMPPYSEIQTAKTTKTMKEIPVILMATKQLLKDADVNAWIRAELAEKVKLSAEWHVLYGDGGSYQLDGFATDTDVQTHLWSGDPTGDNRIDAIIHAGTAIRSGTVVYGAMNRADFAKIRTLKDSTGQYLTGSFGKVEISAQPGNLSIAEYPIVLSEAIPAGDFFLFDFSRASTLWVRDNGSLAFGTINDSFAKGQVAARYAMEAVHDIRHPYAYVYGQWDSAP